MRLNVLSLYTSIVFFLLSTPLLANVPQDILKSPNDTRVYKEITLPNKLTVLLVSDPSTDKAAAALDVNVGSADDPDNTEGLAHFLEHMLFLGTTKYPDPDEYQKFISDHGGGHNAFTSLEHTNYFFDINANYLEGALDRFSQQFTSPLFNNEYIEREVNAVHSEFTAKIKDDSRRIFSALKELLDKNHPYRKFSVGNLETLKGNGDRNLRDTVSKFYNKHYSANIMRLVIMGKEPLSILETFAIAKFSNIPNHNLSTTKIEQDFFKEGFLPAKVEIKSIMHKRSMTVAFPIPSAFKFKKSQPVSYLGNLIGHEGTGSLLSELKEQQLVDSLAAGGQFDTQQKAMFTISMSLTEKGLENQAEILEMLFAYIKLIKQEGIQKIYFDEQAKLLDIGFNYQEKSEPIHLVSALARALHDTPAQRVLYEGYDLSEYDEALYRRYVDHLIPENMLISINTNAIEGDLKSVWYETPYKLHSLSEELLDRLRNPKSNNKLKLPELNIFIPDNTELLSLKTASKPELLSKQEGMTIWYAANTTYGTPKANLFLTLRSPASMQSAKNLNLTELMVAMLKDSLNEFTYPAYLAGLQYQLYNHMRGITIKISGYSDKQSALLNKILLTLRYHAFSADRFEIAKERLQRSLNNAKDKKPYEQAIDAAQRALIEPSWSESERLLALETLNVESLESYRTEFFEVMDTAILSTGNVTRASTLNTGKQVESIVLKSAKRTSVERSKVTRLSGKNDWYSTVPVAHPDTGFVYYIQGTSQSIKERAMFLLLAQILSTDYYAQIRTNKQLGYIVFATNFTLLEVPGTAFIVQSPSTSGENLYKETLLFLEEQTKKLASLSKESLKLYQDAVASRLLKKENTLYARSNRFWGEIDVKNFDFDTKQRLADEVRKYSRDDVHTFFKKLTHQQGKSLLVYSTKLEEKPEIDENLDLLDENARAQFDHF